METETTVLPEELASSVGFLICKAAEDAVARLHERLAPLGIRSRHYGVLALLVARGPMRQVDLAAELRLDRTTMMNVIDDLEEQQFVRRAPHPEDRRAHAITLTSKGETMLRDAHAVIEKTETDFLAPLAPGEQDTLRRLLRQLVA